MGQPVAMGAMLVCSMGATPSSLTVPPTNMVNAENKPVATIKDNVPFLNISPFGVCMSLANPITAAQTAAALGVLTPGLCTPTTTPWAPGSPTVTVKGSPALNATSVCMCTYGGVIKVQAPGTVTESIP
jgi:hypothetical protein